jgi:lipopolysaccharide transport system permease protein
LSVLSVINSKRTLLEQLVIRDLQDAYMGSALNRWWAVLHPLIIIMLYLFVFGVVFRQKLSPDTPSTADFAVYLLPGLCAWLTVSAALSRSATSLVASANLVKQVVFPIELLPVRSVLAAHVPMLIGIVVVGIYAVLRFGAVSPLLPLVLVVIVLQGVLLVGVGLILSTLTVFVRDVRDIVQLFASAGLFVTPILYAPGAVPPWFDAAMFYNPFAYAVWCLQDIFYHQAITRPSAWTALVIVSFVAFWAGSRFFERTRPHLGDVL